MKRKKNRKHQPLEQRNSRPNVLLPFGNPALSFLGWCCGSDPTEHSCGRQHIKLCVLVVSTHDAKTFWQLDMNEFYDSVEVAQVVEALDASKKWEVEKLDSEQQQELKDLTTSV